MCTNKSPPHFSGIENETKSNKYFWVNLKATASKIKRTSTSLIFRDLHHRDILVAFLSQLKLICVRLFHWNYASKDGSRSVSVGRRRRRRFILPLRYTSKSKVSYYGCWTSLILLPLSRNTRFLQRRTTQAAISKVLVIFVLQQWRCVVSITTSHFTHSPWFIIITSSNTSIAFSSFAFLPPPTFHIDISFFQIFMLISFICVLHVFHFHVFLCLIYCFCCLSIPFILSHVPIRDASLCFSSA